MSDTVLSIRDLRVYFNIRAGTVRAVDGVDLDIAEGEKLGLVGESGSGKTTTALAIMRMIKPPGEIAGGTIQLDGRDLVELSEPEMRAVRGNDVAMVPQAAMNALNPVRRIRNQMLDGLRDHGINESSERMTQRLTTLVAQVGLNSNVLNLFPHELSGGMKQRVTIAMAICHKPRLILADEPTSALDVVVQRQVMETLEEVRSEIGRGSDSGRARHGSNGTVRRSDRRHVRRKTRRTRDRRADLFQPAPSLHASPDIEPAKHGRKTPTPRHSRTTTFSVGGPARMPLHASLP